MKRRTGNSFRSLFGALLAGAMWAAPALGQDAGTQTLFDSGVGARAMALGNAYVAQAFDATAVYWNPAGLDHIERSNVTAFYMPLLEGSTYNFIGYAHPSLAAGTLGIGLMNVSTGSIEAAEADGYRSGQTFSYSHTRLLLSYGKQLPFDVTLGGTVKVERQQEAGFRATGVGFDIGLLYTPGSDSPLLSNMKLGVSLINLATPRLKLDADSEVLPRVLRVGISKPVPFGAPGNNLNLLVGYRMNDDADARLNFGTEYIFQNRAMLRAGIDGAVPTFGAGMQYGKYRIDYALSSYSAAVDVGPLRHRISFNIDIGSTRTERIEIARALELQRIQEETVRGVTLQRKLEHQKLMERGKTFYQQGEYFVAMIRFSSAREIFPDDPQTATWLERAQAKLEEQRQAEVEQLASVEIEEATQAARKTFIDQQFERGMQYLEAGRYQDAINEWQRGLDADTTNVLLKNWIAKTETEIQGRTVELLDQARSAERQDRTTVALEYYDKALKEGVRSDEERRQIEQKIEDLRRQLTYNDLFRQGLTDYIEKNYEKAMESFEAALSILPNDPKLIQYLNDAEARANARVLDFPDEQTRRRFLEAVRLIQRENYQEALDILNLLQQKQRYNKRFLDAIDLARERMQER